MESKRFVKSFFMIGLVFTVAAMVSFPVPRACAEPSDKGNPLEQLIENLPQSLRHLFPSAPKFTVEAHEAGKGATQDSSPGDGPHTPPGNDNVCKSISATAFHAISSAQLIHGHYSNISRGKRKNQGQAIGSPSYVLRLSWPQSSISASELPPQHHEVEAI